MEDNQMQSQASIVPILAGKTEEWKQFLAELTGPRHKEHEASRLRAGVKREYVYLQSAPMRDIVVIYDEADDLDRMYEVLATSDDSFDVWFRQRIRALHGFDLSPSAPPSEVFLQWDAPK